MTKPSYFYKFRQVDKYSLSALASCQLWFDKLSNQNDPFEGSYKISVNYKDKDKINIERYLANPPKEVLELIWKTSGLMHPEKCSAIELLEYYARTITQDAVKNLQGSPICSVSSSDVSNNKSVKDPIENTLMWGHYANGLRGFCLVFDADKISECLFNNTDGKIHPVKVTYSNHPATLEVSDFVSVTAAGLEVHKGMDAFDAISKASARKSLDWRGENEARFINLGTEQLVNYDPEALVRIVIGEKMPKGDRELISSILSSKYPNTKIQTAKVKKDSYRLIFLDD